MGLLLEDVEKLKTLVHRLNKLTANLLTNEFQNLEVTTQFDKTSNTTLSNVTGLSATLEAGKKYKFEATLFTSSNVAAGIKTAIAGTATATVFKAEGIITDAGAITTQTRSTAIGASTGAVTAITAAFIKITGYIQVNVAGTLTVQIAQNASNAAASSVLVGSTFNVIEVG